VAGTSFGVVFLAEWGDITQLTTANLAARYDPFLVFTGATLGLWAVAAVAVSVGASSLKLIPMAWIRRVTATIMLGLGVYTAPGRYDRVTGTRRLASGLPARPPSPA
jgi:Ca2+/H+ antiporter, TMEM165/GDT1 family